MQDNIDTASEVTELSTVWTRGVRGASLEAFIDVVEHIVPNFSEGHKCGKLNPCQSVIQTIFLSIVSIPQFLLIPSCILHIPPLVRSY